jgi:hypothetical protein
VTLRANRVGAENPVTSSELQQTHPERLSSLAAYPAVVANDLLLFRITCGGCAAESAGEDRAHCAACHVTFDSIVLFDVHRDGGGCLRPQGLDLVATKNGIWREQASKRRVAG